MMKIKQMLNCHKGFTLVEMLISISLVVILGMVVYSILAGGIKVWHRANTSYIGEDVTIFFEKVSADLRNSFRYTGINFVGLEDKFAFPTYIRTATKAYGLNRGVGEVAYIFSEGDKSILRRKRNSSNIFKNEEGFTQEVIAGVTSCEFQYYSLLEQAWLTQWDEEGVMPKAIAINIKVEYDGKQHEFTKTVIIPVS